MAISVVRYREGDEARWGVVRGDRVAPIDGHYPSTRDFMGEGAARARALPTDAAAPLELAALELLCPITTDRQFLCQAVNYYSHMKEGGISPSACPFNIFFRKASSCLAAADTDIVVPSHVEFLDYEVELGLVFANDVTGAVSVSEDTLHEHVGGLVLVNDVSARDVQLSELQFYKGKSYRSFGPAGPVLALVDRDDLAKFDTLRLRLSVNGETRQDALTTDMVHRPAPTLTELSELQDWEAGDLLATGTPGGTALQAPAAPVRVLAQMLSPARRRALLQKAAARNTKRLRPGDLVEASIRSEDGTIDLGVQRNKVVGGD